MRTKVMAANWKMYKTPDQTRDFFRDFLPLVSGHTRDEIVVCPPFLDLPAALEAAKPGDIVILAGKGHEPYQVLKDRVIHFDDREVASAALRDLGFRRR